MVAISVGADERTGVTDALLAELRRRGFEVATHGPIGPWNEEWPEVGEAVARDVVSGRAVTGVACCHTGTGVSIAANKVAGARAALCADAEIARGARRWNDANVLCLALSRTRPEDVGSILDAWLRTAPDEGERANVERVAVIEAHRDS